MTIEELQADIEELLSKISTLEGKFEDLKNNSVPLSEYNSLKDSISKNSFSNLEVFSKPIRVVGAGATAGGVGAIYIGAGNFGIYFGSGAPTISAAKGSLYLRTNGSGTSDRAYINTDAGTTWTALTTAA